MNLRPATNEDLETVIRWIADEEECRTWAGPVVKFPITVRTLKSEIAFEEGNTYCLDQKGRLLAFGQLIRKSEFRLHMARVIIAPKARHKGNGRLLVRALMDRARQKGCHKVSLNVYRKNTPALKLYIASGFREVTEQSTDALCHMIADTIASFAAHS